MHILDQVRSLVDTRLSRGCQLFEPYEKQRQFFALGADHDVRCLSGGNRTGKTLAVGAGEVAFHLTGLYPDWWEGRRFDKPVVAWVGSTDWSTNIEGVQLRLLGDVAKGELGRGTIDVETGAVVPIGIPADKIIKVWPQSNVPNALSAATVRHVSGGVSRIRFIAYTKGRENLQAGKADIVWMDEEPPLDVATELMARTMDSRGITLLSFTPLKGLSDVVRRFIGDVAINERFPEVLQSALGALVRVRAVDAPHLAADIIAKMRREYPKHEHMARIEGIPALGAGAIFPFLDENITVPWFTPPAHFRILDAIDFGFNHPTARVRCIMNPDTKQIYIVKDYKMQQALPGVHATNWRTQFLGRVPVIWPHDGRNTETDGTSKRDKYRKEGVTFTTSPAELPTGGISVEGGLQLMFQMFSDGTLKVFEGGAPNFMSERAMYRREANKSGVLGIVKEFDDVMDAARYCIMGLLCGQGRTIAEAFAQSYRQMGRRLVRDDDNSDYGGDDPLFS